jgi:hypothetical protein
MSTKNITDCGKIWLRGYMRPDYAVRVNDIYIVVGEGDCQSKDYLYYRNYLFVAFYYPEKKSRVFRRFSLDLVSKSQGSLFSGFNQTKHSDIKAITFRDEGVEEFIGGENDFFLDVDGKIDPIKVILLTGWK